MRRRPVARERHRPGEEFSQRRAPDGAAGNQGQHIGQDQHELRPDAAAALDRHALGPVQRSVGCNDRVTDAEPAQEIRKSSGGAMNVSSNDPVEPTIEDITASLPRRLHEVMTPYAAVAPDRVALIEDGAKWTYRELDNYVRQTAEHLSAFGVRAGDRMMIVSENCIALAALLLAASRLDAWAIVCNPRLSAREIDQIRDHSGARRMFFTCGISREAAAHASRCGADVLSFGPLRDIGVSALNETTGVEAVEDSAARQVAVLIYTSGTTGKPKGVMLTHQNLLVSAKTTAVFRRMTNRDKVYVVLPISHIVGVSLLIMTLMVGGTV